MNRLFWVLLGFLVTASALAAPPSPASLPDALRDWVDWVLDDATFVACPLRVQAEAGDEASYACAWPGELSIEAGGDGARFAQRWQVYARGAVPLPGGGDAWPQRVRANGAAVPVVPDEEGAPVVWLEPGTYAIDGALDWQERPESIALPDDVALVRLAVDGAAIFPVQREDGALWLGRAESAAKQEDSLELQVFRMLTDAVPARLATRIVLTVSGEGREEALGKPLPEGWRPVALTSDLPARLDPDGTLRVQVRPGTWTITLDSRAGAPLTALARPASAAPWPDEEIWSYQSDAKLRVTAATGTNPIDPSQAGVPAEWQRFPAFLMRADESLAIEERSRGLATQDQNRLTLARTMWLDFDGGSFGTQDRISGSMVRDWRLDVAQPFSLERASENGEGLLVTQGGSPELTGVELRSRNVNLEANTRLARSGGNVPITGWQHAFDSVSTTVNLPPGYRLFAAFGADAAPDAWLSRWNLLDVFLVAIVTMLAAWLIGRPAAALVLGYLVLAFHEDGAPLFALLAVIVLALLQRSLPQDGRLARVAGWARNAALVVLVLVALPFAASEVRMALYPQLERWSTDYAAVYSNVNDAPMDAAVVYDSEPIPMAPPAPAPQVAMEEQIQQEVRVQGSRMPEAKGGYAKRRSLQRYASNTIVQAGRGQAAWSWSGYSLSWSGPVLPAQDVRLVISPPWLTRLLRLGLVVLLALVVVRLARAAFARPAVPPRAGVAGAALAFALLMPGSALAEATPTPELLEELKTRMLEAPDCAPNCAAIARADVVAAGDRIRVALEVHAAARSAVPLPGEEALLGVARIAVDGIAEPGVLRDEEGTAWIAVDRGVRRVEIEFRAADADQIGLRFALAPAHVVFEGTDWEAGGLRDGRLLTDTLQLTRVRSGTEPSSTASVAQQFPPFVRVTRNVDFELEWQVTTQVDRIAPDQAAFSVGIPLLEGERLLSAEYKVENGRVIVPFQAGVASVSYVSQIERVDRLSLVAPELSRHAEVWQLRASPMWNLRYEGVPAVHPGDAEWVHEFHPLPGETLELTIGRPEPVAGATLAIDNVTLTSSVGKRAVEHSLSLTLRSTQGGQHVIVLPKDAEVLGVTLGGEAINVRPDDGRLALPVRPGSQQADIQWRETKAISALVRTPEVSLGAQASNLRLQVNLPEDRWLLDAGGPTVGPAVLYWGELLVLTVVALGLAATRRTPLGVWQWLLLGLGFSTVSWPALLVVVGFLLAMDWRARNVPESPLAFNLVQLGLAAFGVVAALTAIAVVPISLVGTPDMHVTGNGSTAYSLSWFHDRTADAMPQAYAFAISIWWYRFAMFAWALWAATAAVQWGRWAWAAWRSGGYWRSAPKREPAPVVAAVEPVPAAPTEPAPPAGDAPKPGA